MAEIRIDETLSIIGAFVVPAEGAAPDEAEILTFVRERLAVYKCPKQVWLKPGLPRILRQTAIQHQRNAVRCEVDDFVQTLHIVSDARIDLSLIFNEVERKFVRQRADA